MTKAPSVSLRLLLEKIEKDKDLAYFEYLEQQRLEKNRQQLEEQYKDTTKYKKARKDLIVNQEYDIDIETRLDKKLKQKAFKELEKEEEEKLEEKKKPQFKLVKKSQQLEITIGQKRNKPEEQEEREQQELEEKVENKKQKTEVSDLLKDVEEADESDY